MRTMQRAKPWRFGRTPVKTNANLMVLIRRPAVQECYSLLDLMETRAGLQRKFRRKAS